MTTREKGTPGETTVTCSLRRWNNRINFVKHQNGSNVETSNDEPEVNPFMKLYDRAAV
jgi:hypothetical protein